MELLLAGVRLPNKRIRMLLHLIGLSEKVKFRRSIGEGYLDFLQPAKYFTLGFEFLEIHWTSKLGKSLQPVELMLNNDASCVGHIAVD